MIPTAFFFRATACGMFMFITDPSDWYAYVVGVALVLGSCMESITVDVLLFRTADTQIRGSLYGISIASGYLGQMFFVFCGGMLFDDVGPYWPFVLVGCLDVTFGLGAVVLSLCGVIKNDIEEKKKET